MAKFKHGNLSLDRDVNRSLLLKAESAGISRQWQQLSAICGFCCRVFCRRWDLAHCHRETLPHSSQGHSPAQRGSPAHNDEGRPFNGESVLLSQSRGQPAQSGVLPTATRTTGSTRESFCCPQRRGSPAQRGSPSAAHNDEVHPFKGQVLLPQRQRVTHLTRDDLTETGTVTRLTRNPAHSDEDYPLNAGVRPPTTETQGLPFNTGCPCVQRQRRSLASHGSPLSCPQRPGVTRSIRDASPAHRGRDSHPLNASVLPLYSRVLVVLGPGGTGGCVLVWSWLLWLVPR
ncbi:hypothetical protein QBC39DRAFT_34268 [Podospora conica]|nr:hypothetical protein QBC39DRAFT_34268 [Schizothecium conicum]